VALALPVSARTSTSGQERVWISSSAGAVSFERSKARLAHKLLDTPARVTKPRGLVQPRITSSSSSVKREYDVGWICAVQTEYVVSTMYRAAPSLDRSNCLVASAVSGGCERRGRERFKAVIRRASGVCSPLLDMAGRYAA
jgi:hypothetical protein